MMPAVSGRNRQGTWTVLAPGDHVSGYTFGGRLVHGTVVETVKPAEVKIEGAEISGQPVRGRWTLAVRDILAVAR